MFTTVLLTEKALTEHDVRRIAALHGDEPVRVHVVVPAHEAADVQAEVDASVAGLQAAGMAEVDGETTGDHPVPAVVEIVRRLNADEVVVLTEPHLVTDLIRRDWATRLRHELDLPVLHVVLGTDQVVS